MKIAYKIPDLETENDVTLAFHILKGECPFSDEEAQHFLLDVIALSQEEPSINNEGWTAAKSWAEWWMRPRTLIMCSKAYKQMTDADWALIPNNTNAVESQNRVSQIQTTKLINVVRQYYTTDKNSVYRTLAAAKGIGAGPSQGKRKAYNEKTQSTRRVKRLKKNEKLLMESEEIEEEEDPFIGKSVLVHTKAKRGRKFHWLSAKLK